jgi:hypothetical protein
MTINPLSVATEGWLPFDPLGVVTAGFITSTGEILEPIPVKPIPVEDTGMVSSMLMPFPARRPRIRFPIVLEVRTTPLIVQVGLPTISVKEIAETLNLEPEVARCLLVESSPRLVKRFTAATSRMGTLAPRIRLVVNNRAEEELLLMISEDDDYFG